MNKYVNILLVIGVASVMSLMLAFSVKHDAKVMAVEYCWDNQGNHYVAPNANCTH